MMMGAAQASVVTEEGDAGGTALGAQDALGATTILGALQDDGTGTADVDFYRVFVSDVGAFAVDVTADLSEDNDTYLFLFDADLNLVLEDDDGGDLTDGEDDDLLSRFAAGELAEAGGTTGFYFLVVTIFDAVASDGGLVTVDPDPLQFGDYALALDGVSEVPLPGAALFALTGLAGAGLVRRRG